MTEHKTSLRYYALLILLGLVILFAVQNAATVEIQFLFWSLAIPRALMVFLVFIVGCLVGWGLAGLQRHRDKRRF